MFLLFAEVAVIGFIPMEDFEGEHNDVVVLSHWFAMLSTCCARSLCYSWRCMSLKTFVVRVLHGSAVSVNFVCKVVMCEGNMTVMLHVSRALWSLTLVTSTCRCKYNCVMLWCVNKCVYVSMCACQVYMCCVTIMKDCVSIVLCFKLKTLKSAVPFALTSRNEMKKRNTHLKMPKHQTCSWCHKRMSKLLETCNFN